MNRSFLFLSQDNYLYLERSMIFLVPEKPYQEKFGDFPIAIVFGIKNLIPPKKNRIYTNNDKETRIPGKMYS